VFWSSTKRSCTQLPVTLICVAALLVLASVGAAPAQDTLSPRVLLVGNSYTRFNMMPRILQRLAESAGVPLNVEFATERGATLRRHWLQLGTRERIQRGHYSFVVIQDHSLRPIDRLPEFEDYGARFVRAVTASGATPVLLQTWARSEQTRFYRKRESPRSAREMEERLASAYGMLATREGARVAAVGRAFSMALSQSPEIELYREDGTHPSVAGSYLAACTLLAAITGQDPRSASYVPWELAPDQALRLRELAGQLLAHADAGAVVSAEAAAATSNVAAAR
jgi:hypothetical protein